MLFQIDEEIHFYTLEMARFTCEPVQIENKVVTFWFQGGPAHDRTRSDRRLILVAPLPLSDRVRSCTHRARHRVRPSHCRERSCTSCTVVWAPLGSASSGSTCCLKLRFLFQLDEQFHFYTLHLARFTCEPGQIENNVFTFLFQGGPVHDRTRSDRRLVLVAPLPLSDRVRSCTHRVRHRVRPSRCREKSCTSCAVFWLPPGA